MAITLKRRKRIIENVVINLLLIAVLLITLFPIYWMLVTSLKTQMEAFALPPAWFFSPTLENYIEIFRLRPFFHYILNSLIISTTTVVFTLIIGTIAAFSLARFSFKGRDHIAMWFLSTQMVPPIVALIPFFLILKNLFLLDTHLGMIMIYSTFTLPYIIWMMRGFIAEIPADIEESAMVHGCSRLQAFRKVIFPLILPGLAATGIFCFIICWNEFLAALILTGDDAKTLPVAVIDFMSEQGIMWSQVCAAGTVMIIPILIMSSFVQKYMIRGLAYGALKG
jgi:multiple sugar transport system permease protein